MQKKQNQKPLFKSILGIILVSSLILNGYFLINNNSTRGYKSSATNNDAQSELINLIDQEYLRERPEIDEIEDGKLKGIVASLKDPYSQYLTSEEFKNFTSSLNQKYEGIGISFEKQNGEFIVLNVFKSSPAESQGLQSGDSIFKVSGELIGNLTIEEVASKIKGEGGTEVELTIIREGQEIVKKIKREAIKIDLVTLEKKDNVGVIQITSFGEDLKSELRKISDEIIADNEIQSLILDLRSNNGGYLQGAIESSSHFLEPDSLVLQEQSKTDEKTFKSKEVSNSLKNYPLVVIVDGFTASASEILAASLRDNRGVKLVGETTFGKGVVQEVFNFNGGLVKLTTNEWLTPNGEKINEKGLEVDIAVNEDQDALEIAIENLKN